MLGAELTLFFTSVFVVGEEKRPGGRWANTHRLRSVNRLSSTCVMLSRAERWVSRSVVNRADARGGIWDVEVVEEIIGRPLHHTLLIVESQQAVSSVFQCPCLLHPPAPYSRLSGRRRAEGIMAVDLTVLGQSVIAWGLLPVSLRLWCSFGVAASRGIRRSLPWRASPWRMVQGHRPRI